MARLAADNDTTEVVEWDVYKRQTYNTYLEGASMNKTIEQAQAAKISLLRHFGIMFAVCAALQAVSYTHLDVYKRQEKALTVLRR